MQKAESRFRNLTLIIILLLSLLASPDSVLSQPPIKVGTLIPFTGRWGDSGRECAKGMLDAGRWLNQRGGIYGRRLEISLIEDTSQIDPLWLEGVECAAVTAGASAPEYLVQEVVDYFRARGVSSVEEVEAIEERVTFTPPPELVREIGKRGTGR